MVNLSDFVDVPEETLGEPRESDEKMILIHKGMTFSELWDLARQTRKTHPDEPVEWYADGKKGDENTYALWRAVKNGN